MKIPLFSRLDQFFSNRLDLLLYSEEEKEKFERYFLSKAEKIISSSISKDSLKFEKDFFAAMLWITKLNQGNTDPNIRIAELYFDWAQFSKRSKGALISLYFTLSALKIETRESKRRQLLYLSAKMLTFLEDYFPEEGLLEYSLELFQEAESLYLSENKIETSLFYWDFAKAWYLSGLISEELADLNKSLQLFEQAQLLGCDLPQFHFDFGVLLIEIAVVKGEGALIRGAITHFESALPSSYLSEDDQINRHEQELKEKLWIWLARASFILFNQTGTEENLILADHYHQEALLAAPSKTFLWLQWGELFLIHAWIYKNPASAEKAIEKLTSLKIPDEPSPSAALLLGEALMLLGELLDDYHLIKLGEKRLRDGIHLTDELFCIDKGKATIALLYGLYYAQESYFEEAYEYFQSALLCKRKHLSTLRHLLRTCIAWGIWTENPFIIEKSAVIAERLCQMVPEMAYHWIGRGLALFHLYKIEKKEIAYLEESIVAFKKGISLSADQVEQEHLFYLGAALELYGDETGCEEDLEQAITIFKALLEQSPHASNTRYHLALALFHLGELNGDFALVEQALLYFSEMATEGEEDSSFWVNWGYALLLNSYLKAPFTSEEEINRIHFDVEVKMQKAIRRGASVAFYHLACLYSLSGRSDLAMNALSEAQLRGVLPPLEEMNRNDWLDHVRKSKEYADFVNEQNNKFSF